MANIQQLLETAEQRKLSAERKVSDLGTQATRYWDDLEKQGISASKMSSSQVTRGEYLNSQHRKAIDEVKAAEASLQSLREVAADEDKITRASLEVHEAAPGEERKRADSTAPQWVRDDGRPAALQRGQRFSDHPLVREHTEAMSERDRHVIGEYGSLGQMIRALSTTGSASALVPQVWSNQVIDLARTKAQVLNAGAQVVPMDRKQVNVGRLVADPVAGFRLENTALPLGDPTFDTVTLTAKTLAGQVVASQEFMMDAPQGEQVVTDALAAAIGLKLDFVCLYGGLLTADSTGFEGYTTDATQPTGVLKTLLANAPSQVLGSQTNGTAITGATPYNELLDTVFAVKNNNLQPNAYLLNTKMSQKYAKTYDSTGQPLQQPPALAALRQFETNQISSYTRGTMTNTATNVFCAKWDELLVGQRMGLELRVLNERYAELNQVSVIAVTRVDVALARPNAFAVYRALGGS